MTKIASTNDNPLQIFGDITHIHSVLMFWVVYIMGEALINLVQQFPALWDKEDPKYKDGNHKDAKWKEITDVLGLGSEYKWKTFSIFNM